MKKILLTVKLPVFIIGVMIFQFNLVSGQVSTLQKWTSVYHGTSTAQQNINFPVPAGSNTNRILVVAIASTRTPVNPLTVTLTYGGQGLTLVNGDMSVNAQQHTALYFLNEAGLDAASNTILSVAVGGPTICLTDVWASVFDHVNQTDPVTNSQTKTSGSGKVTTIEFGTALTIDAYNQAVEIVSCVNPVINQMRTINYAENWTKIRDSTIFFNNGFNGFSIRNGVANRSIPNSSATDISTTTFSGLALGSMTALSLNYQAPPPPTVQASNVGFSDVTSSSFTINWTPGDGTNHLVLAKAGSGVITNPENNISYTASNLFGSGTQIGDYYVVYNGTENSVNLVNLDANTAYYVAVYEFSGPPGLEFYLTTIPPATGNQLTGQETALTDDYRSAGSGNWGSAATWQTFVGGSWVPAGTAPTYESGIITIRNGHTVTVTESVTVDQVVVETDGQISIDSGITLTIHDDTDDDIDCIENGTLYNGGSVVAEGILAFNSGSTYNHALNGGTIPTATWDANSLCLITGITDSAPSGSAQTFGNFTWNCELQTSTVALNSDFTVIGNFRLTNTGIGKLAIIDGSSSGTITVTGNFFQTGGTFDLNSGPASTAIAYLKVTGNFSFTDGFITESSSGSGNIVFNGNGSPQTYTSGGTLTNTISFTVESGAYLQMGTGTGPSFIAGSNGTFTLSSGATLGITDRYGITTGITGSNGGNIRVSGTRSFSTEANYFYNGFGKQNTGGGLPLTVNSLAFDNAGGVITLDAARTINSFSITTGSIANLGIFTHLSNSLALGGIGQPGNTYGHSSSPAIIKNDTFFDAATGIVNNQPPAGTWLGITADWNTASNWVGGVPTSGTNAIIPLGPQYQPIVLSAPLAECNNVTIESGASLTVNAGQAITILGNLSNSGTLYLKSSESGIASLIVNTYTDNGAENIELFLTGGGDETNYPWHYISSPVAALPVTDVISGGIGPDANDLIAYYETLVTDNKDQAWIGYDGWDYQSANGLPRGTTFNVLEVGTGYNYYSYYDATRIFGGNLNTGDVIKSLSYTGATPGLEVKGWNFLGNPFSSSLDWDDIALSLPVGEIDNAIYFTRNNSVVSYVGGVPSGSGVTGNIPPMQGFFVKANSSGQSITLPASARVHSTQTRYKGDGEAIPLIRLKIESNKISDETVIRFDEKARNTFDSNLDAYKFGKSGTSVSLWSVSGPVSYSINSIPFPETKTEIPVGINTSGSGTFKLTASQVQGLDNYSIYLFDKSTGTNIDLRTSTVLNFHAAGGMVTDRFVIRVSNLSTVTENPSLSGSIFNIYSSNDFINIQPLSEEWDGKTGSIEVIDITGKPVSRTDNAEFTKNSLIQIPATGFRGIYFVKMQSGLLRQVGKVMVK